MPRYAPDHEFGAARARVAASSAPRRPGVIGLGLGLALGVITAVASAEQAPATAPLARVDGKPVSAEAFMRDHPQFSSWFGHGVITLDDALARLEQSILGKLLAKEARATGIAGDPEVQRAIDGLLAQAYLLRRFPPETLQVPEAEVRAKYDSGREAYRAPQRLRVSHILVPSEDEAVAVRAALDAGRDFEEFAALHSQDPNFPDSKGDVGWVRLDHLPDAFAGAIEALDIGQPSKVIETRFGFHVAVVTDRAPDEYIPYGDVSGKIAQALRERRRTEQMASLRAELFERYRVQVDREALAARIESAPRPELTVETGDEKDASTRPEHPELAILSTYHEVDAGRPFARLYGLVRNVGGAELTVRKVKASCRCMRASIVPATLAPGQMGRLFVEVALEGADRPAPARHGVIIETNNPRKPTDVVRVGIVEARETAAAGGTTGDAGPRLFADEPVKLGEGKQWKFNPLVVDVDGDGRAEIVATHRQPVRQNALHAWKRKDDGAWEPLPQRWESPGYSELTSADVNRDGRVDLVAASHYTAVLTLLGSGDGAFRTARVEGPASFVSAALGDFDGDGLLDLVALSQSEKGGLQVFRGDGAGGWTPGPRLDEGRFAGRQVKVADFNGDGHLDILAVGGNDLTGIYYGDANGAWKRGDVRFPSSTGSFSGAAIADIDGDGHLDIALNGGSDGTSDREGPSVFLGDGAGRFRAASEGLKRFRFTSRGIAVADLDGDGRRDLVALASHAEVGDIDPLGQDPALREFGDDEYGLFVFSRDRQGRWSLRTDSGLPASGLAEPNGLAVDDVNGDGRVDLVVSHGMPMSEGGYISVWLQE